MLSTISDGEHIALLEAKIKGLYTQIGHLKSRINCYTPISKLSPEIMRRIFIYVRQFSWDPRMDLGQWEWIQQVSHVCRYWRTTALRYKELWSKITCESPRCATLLLERSRPRPMSLILRGEELDAEREEAMWNVLRETCRLKNLVFHCCISKLDTSMHEYLQSFPPASAPMLQRIHLEMNDGGLSHQPGYVPPCLPAHLFNRQTPRLRHVEIMGWSIPWNDRLFNDLTILKLGTHQIFPLTFPGTPADFFAALERMPALQKLDLSQLFPSEMSTFREKGRVILFECMEDFRLKAPTTHCATILKHLALPITASVTLVPIELTDNRKKWRPSSNLLELDELIFAIHVAWLRDCLSLVSSIPIFEVLQASDNYPFFYKVTISGHQQWNPEAAQLKAYVHIDKPHSEFLPPLGTLTISAAIVPLLETLPIARVQSVEIRDRGTDWPTTGRHAIFKHFRKVKCIVLKDHALHFMDYISGRPKGSNRQAEKHNVIRRFSNLAELTLDGVKYADVSPISRHRNRAELSYSIKLEEFLDFLRTRCDLEVPIQRLRLVNSNLSEKNAECLKAFAVDVEWVNK